MEIKKYILAAIQNNGERNVWLAELKGKRWVCSVVASSQSYCFATHEAFDVNIFIPSPAFTEQVVPPVASTVEMEVGADYDKKKMQWGFIGVNAKVLTLGEPPARKAAVKPPPPGKKHSAKSPVKKKSVKSPAKRRATATTNVPAIKKMHKRVYKIASPSPGVYACEKLSSNIINIYIDEGWVGAVPDAARPYNEGVIVGIVWMGQSPDPKMLPSISNHLYAKGLSTIEAALRNLFTCPQSLAFMMPIQVYNTDDSAQPYYDLLLRTCIKVLLGWMLPSKGDTRISVNLYMEQISQHTVGEDITQRFAGYLDTLKQGRPGRFNCWEITGAKFVDKDFGYIAYADLLSYLCHEHTDKCKELGRWTNFKEHPGYLPLKIALSQQLDDIDRLEDLGNVEQVWNFIADTHGTALCRLVMDDLKQRLSGRPDLQEKLIEALEGRYQKKERDLRQLRGLSSVLSNLVDVEPEALPKRIQMMLFALQLQKANHHGDPEQAARVREAYLQVRKDVREEDRDLAAYVDLNVAVSYGDSFQFSEAKSFAEAVTGDPLFEALRPVMRGRAWSALGQYHAIQGNGDSAETCFVWALEQFDKADLKPEERLGEYRQTGVYRAINAMDAHLPNAKELVHAVIPLEERTIQKLAADGTHKKEYLHHLLVRALYYLPELQNLRTVYLSARDTWECGYQHPWELICLYRGLLLLDSEVSNAKNLAAKKFVEGTEICFNGEHGVTLNLIGAMIATVAFCATGQEAWRNMTVDKLARIEENQSGMATTIAIFQQALSLSPALSTIPLVLEALPFNYH